MPHKRRKSTKASRKTTPASSKYGKVGNWGSSSWSDGGQKSKPDSYNKTMAKAFK